MGQGGQTGRVWAEFQGFGGQSGRIKINARIHYALVQTAGVSESTKCFTRVVCGRRWVRSMAATKGDVLQVRFVPSSRIGEYRARNGSGQRRLRFTYRPRYPPERRILMRIGRASSRATMWL